MARIARVIAPDYPHHITQRGNRRQPTFFCDADYKTYIGLMAEWCKKHKVEISPILGTPYLFIDFGFTKTYH